MKIVNHTRYDTKYLRKLTRTVLKRYKKIILSVTFQTTQSNYLNCNWSRCCINIHVPKVNCCYNVQSDSNGERDYCSLPTPVSAKNIAQMLKSCGDEMYRKNTWAKSWWEYEAEWPNEFVPSKE